MPKTPPSREVQRERRAWAVESDDWRLDRAVRKGFRIKWGYVAIAYLVEFMVIGASLGGAWLFAGVYSDGDSRSFYFMLLAPLVYAAVELCRVPLAILARTQRSYFVRGLAILGIIFAAGVTTKSVSQLGEMMFHPRLMDAARTKTTLKGWVRTRRDSKAGLSFINLNDGSCFADVQIVAPADLPNYEAEVTKLTTGCSIEATGELVESKGKGQAVELKADSITVLGWVDDPDTYPVSAKRHTFEYLREVAHLRVRTNTFGAVARVRNCLAQAVHRFYHERGFSTRRCHARSDTVNGASPGATPRHFWVPA